MVTSNLTSLFLAAFVSSSTFRTQNNRASDASPLRGSPRKLQAEVKLGDMICGDYEPGCTKGSVEGTVWWKDGAVELRGTKTLRDIYLYDRRVPTSLHREVAGTNALKDFTSKAANVDAGADGKLNLKTVPTATTWTLAAEQFGFLQRTDTLFIVSWCRFAHVEFGYAEITNVGELYDKINPPAPAPLAAATQAPEATTQAPTAAQAAAPAPTTTNAGATTSADCNTVCTSADTKKPLNKMCTKYCDCTGAGSGMMKETAYKSMISLEICPVQCGNKKFKQRAASCDECKNTNRKNTNDKCNGRRSSSCKWQPGVGCIPK